MATTQPSTNIILCENVLLDKNYRNTIFWEQNQQAQQLNYFMSKKKHDIPNTSYQRVGVGIIDIQLPYESCYQCNYMLFNNTGFENKWFFAFITKVDYSNNNCTRITYEIDVLQSWYFDCVLLDSFVEREHSLTDEVGENVIDEPVSIGEYLTSGFTDTGLFNDWSIIVASGSNLVGDAVGGKKYGGVYCGVEFFKFSTSDTGVQAVNDFLIGLADLNKQDEVVAIYLVPDFAYNESVLVVRNHTVNKPTRLGSYTPRNKKLLTYPYTQEIVSTFTGENTYLRYEDFTSNEMQFSITGDITPNSTFLCVPMNYQYNGGNFNNACTMSKLPMCVYTTDSYRAWLAQNKDSLDLQTQVGVIGGASALIGGVATGNVAVAVGGGLSIYSSIMNSLNQLEKAQLQPNVIRGSASGVVECALGVLDFHFAQMYIKEENAKIIDDFFTMFGYATKRVKIPNRHARKNWTYTQTTGCNIKCNCSSEDLEKIKRIYDNGITFWVNGDSIGNYSLDNGVL